MVKPKKLVMKSTKKVIPVSPSEAKKKRKKKNFESYAIYLFRVLKQIGEQMQIDNIGISRNTMTIMDDFVVDMLEKIAAEAGRLAKYSKKPTLSSNDIFSATKLLLPEEIAKHAINEGMRALNTYHRSIETMEQTTKKPTNIAKK